MKTSKKIDPVIPAFVYEPSLFPFEVIRMANGWHVALATINATLAGVMLALNSPRQRNERPSAVEKYRRDQVAGVWRLTHQGIAFDARGELFDGQNRLRAVTLSNAPVECFVWFGAGDDRAMQVLDTGANRGVADAAAISGVEVSHADISLARQMSTGEFHAKTMTNVEVLATLAARVDCIRWVNDHLPSRHRLGLTPIRAAVARAYYHVPHEVLARFVGIYLNDIARDGSPAEQVPAVLANFVMGGSKGKRFAAQAYEVRGKALRAIEAFADRVPIAMLVHTVTNQAIYPLPPG